MKKVFKFFMYSAMAVAVVAACTKDPVTDGTGNTDDPKDPGTEQPGNKENVTLEEVSLTARPTGDTLTFELEAAAAWTIAADECDWVTAEPASGEAGTTTVTFYVDENKAGKDRSVSFFVAQAETETLNAGETYEVFISQVKMELPILQEDYEFLKWMVDNNAYGQYTPTVDDWYSFTGEGFPCINFQTDAAGKFFIESIYFYTGDAANINEENLFNALPPTVNLPNCTSIYVNCTAAGTEESTVIAPLKGSELPTEWNCPNLWRLHLECVGLQGVITESFAQGMPKLEQLFFRCCDLYGALPHDWNMPVLGNLVIGYGGREADCPNMGYVWPASLDIILNSAKTEEAGERQRDKGGIHQGGAKANWLGYEIGWGQERYVKFDGGAENDLTTWSDYRGLTTEKNTDEVAAGGIRNPKAGNDNAWYIDSWAWYFWRETVARQLVEWDQDDADAFTAAAAAKDRIFTR